MPQQRAAVIVFGDLGRSPRMQRHAVALASRGIAVDLIGFGDTPLPGTVAGDSRIRVHHLWNPSRSPAVLMTAVRQIVLAVELALVLLVRVRRADFVLVQNPPALPTFPVVLALAPLLGARVIADWHNFTTDMLRPGPRANRRLVRFVAAMERLGRHAAAHLAVSHALAAELARRYGVDSAVLHDHPTAEFQPSASKVHRIICPTSWSPDEDFELLIDAARRLEDHGVAVAFLVTGRGELRDEYQKKFADLRLHHVELKTAWVPPDDYPAFLASADLGLCLHRSASGVDLPIKLAEMRGCALPALVLDYGDVLREVVREGESAIFFTTAEELASRLPAGPAVDAMRAAMAANRSPRWEEEWLRVAWPVVGA